MADDKLSSTDIVHAGLSTDVVPPQYPCPACGKATKDNNTREMLSEGKHVRICSVEACRAQADWASGSGVLLGN
jgi:hypothetical protein